MRAHEGIALLRSPFFEFNERCYGKIVTYTPTPREIKRKRARGGSARRIGRHKKSLRNEGGREGERKLSHECTGCCTSSGKYSWKESFSGAAAYTSESVFYFSRRNVWRQFHCAFHSVGRFEIQARILFVLEQRGDKGGVEER